MEHIEIFYFSELPQSIRTDARRATDFSAPYPDSARRLAWSPLRASKGRSPRSITQASKDVRSFRLQPSSEALLILQLLHRSRQGVAWSILNCARRTSTFLSCAFREQEDDQATRLILLRPRVARAQKIISLHPLLVRPLRPRRAPGRSPLEPYNMLR